MNIQDKTLRTILAEHKQWVDSNGKEGAKADFSCLNLSYVNFSHIERAFRRGYSAGFTDGQDYINKYDTPAFETFLKEINND